MSKTNLKKHIYIIGYMGTGKSTVGKILSEQAKLPLIETDEIISEQFGMDINDIFDIYGENDFRDAETDLLKDISILSERSIISCGGGLPLNKTNRELMQNSGTVVLLTASPDVILNRIALDDLRPLLKGKKNVSDILEMLNSRMPFYLDAADLIIDTDGKTSDGIAKEILEELSD